MFKKEGWTKNHLVISTSTQVFVILSAELSDGVACDSNGFGSLRITFVLLHPDLAL